MELGIVLGDCVEVGCEIVLDLREIGVAIFQPPGKMVGEGVLRTCADRPAGLGVPEVQGLVRPRAALVATALLLL